MVHVRLQSFKVKITAVKRPGQGWNEWVVREDNHFLITECCLTRLSNYSLNMLPKHLSMGGSLREIVLRASQFWKSGDSVLANLLLVLLPFLFWKSLKLKMGMRDFLGVTKCSKVGLWWWLHNSVNLLEVIEVYT